MDNGCTSGLDTENTRTLNSAGSNPGCEQPTGKAGKFSTALTQSLGIRHPILCGGLMWLANAKYVGAVVNAGGMGFITPRSYPSLSDFKAGLRECNDLTAGKPFGVNLFIAARDEENTHLHDYLDLSLKEGVRVFETAGRSPEAILSKIHQAGGKVFHKVTALRHAVKAARIGVDGVIVLGGECGGHPGANTVPAMVMAALIRPQITVPLIVGGGIGSGRQLLAALALGADGVLMGSRMLVADEIWAHTDYKQRLLEADENATRTVLSSVGNTYRCLDNKTARKVSELEAAGVRDFETLAPYIRGVVQREAYTSGDFEKGILSLGPAIAFADRLEPVADIIDRIVQEAVDASKILNKKQLSPEPV